MARCRRRAAGQVRVIALPGPWASRQHASSVDDRAVPSSTPPPDKPCTEYKVGSVSQCYILLSADLLNLNTINSLYILRVLIKKI